MLAATTASVLPCLRLTRESYADGGRIEGVRDRLAAAGDRVREGVVRALAGDHTPQQIAASFAFAALYTALPTAGTAWVLFVALAALTDRVSRVALLAALVVFNPVVKWGIYAVSYPLGAVVLGGVPGVGPDTVPSSIAWDAAEAVLIRQLFGNAVIALALAVVGYAVVLSLARWYEGTDATLADEEPNTTPAE